MHAWREERSIGGDRRASYVRTGGARERVPAAFAVVGDVVDEREVLVHRPRPAPELVPGALLLAGRLLLVLFVSHHLLLLRHHRRRGGRPARPPSARRRRHSREHACAAAGTLTLLKHHLHHILRQESRRWRRRSSRWKQKGETTTELGKTGSGTRTPFIGFQPAGWAGDGAASWGMRGLEEEEAKGKRNRGEEEDDGWSEGAHESVFKFKKKLVKKKSSRKKHH